MPKYASKVGLTKTWKKLSKYLDFRNFKFKKRTPQVNRDLAFLASEVLEKNELRRLKKRYQGMRSKIKKGKTVKPLYRKKYA